MTEAGEWAAARAPARRGEVCRPCRNANAKTVRAKGEENRKKKARLLGQATRCHYQCHKGGCPCMHEVPRAPMSGQ